MIPVTVWSNQPMHTHWALPDDIEKRRYWSDACNVLDPVMIGLYEDCRCVLALDLLEPGLALAAFVESPDKRLRARFAARYSTDRDGYIIPNVTRCVLFGGSGHLPDDLPVPLRTSLKHTLRVESLAALGLADTTEGAS